MYSRTSSGTGELLLHRIAFSSSDVSIQMSLSALILSARQLNCL
ncbi:hypothetical protein [Ruegeria arenilitoris]|nr:hypothetical protein [Ruegeria arenilitoris]